MEKPEKVAPSISIGLPEAICYAFQKLIHWKWGEICETWLRAH